MYEHRTRWLAKPVAGAMAAPVVGAMAAPVVGAVAAMAAPACISWVGIHRVHTPQVGFF